MILKQILRYQGVRGKVRGGHTAPARLPAHGLH